MLTVKIWSTPRFWCQFHSLCASRAYIVNATSNSTILCQYRVKMIVNLSVPFDNSTVWSLLVNLLKSPLHVKIEIYWN